MLLCFLFGRLTAQQSARLSEMNHYLTNSLEVDIRKFIDDGEYKNAYVFSLAIYVNKNGRAEQVFISKNLNDQGKLYFNFSKFKEKILAEKKIFSGYSNVVMLVPVLLKREKDYYINESTFSNFANFLPVLPEDKKVLKVVFIPSLVYSVFRIVD